MKRITAMLIALSLCAGLCACGEELPQESRLPLPDGTTTVTTTTGTMTVDTAQGQGDATTTTADTTASVGTTSTLSNRPTTDTAGTSSVTTTTMATTTATTTTITATTAATTTTVTTTTTATTTNTTTTTTTKPTVNLQQGDMAGKSLREGDRMYDITVTDTDGNAIVLSQLLQEKEIVVLNFWFINCPFCIKEFPVMSDFYSQYGDRVGMVALNPIDGAANTNQFRQSNADLLFPIAVCPYAWAQSFRITGYPTSVVIDKEGIIRKIHTGALLKESDWVTLYEQCR